VFRFIMKEVEQKLTAFQETNALEWSCMTSMQAFLCDTSDHLASCDVRLRTSSETISGVRSITVWANLLGTNDVTLPLRPEYVFITLLCSIIFRPSSGLFFLPWIWSSLPRILALSFCVSQRQHNRHFAHTCHHEYKEIIRLRTFQFSGSCFSHRVGLYLNLTTFEGKWHLKLARYVPTSGT
jgi:hypothetical protein